jgi:hypothetical protein
LIAFARSSEIRTFFVISCISLHSAHDFLAGFLLLVFFAIRALKAKRLRDLAKPQPYSRLESNTRVL